jgi:hypothetical protein
MGTNLAAIDFDSTSYRLNILQECAGLASLCIAGRNGITLTVQDADSLKMLLMSGHAQVVKLTQPGRSLWTI